MPGYKGHLNGGLIAGGLVISAAVLLGYLTFNLLHFAGLLGCCLLGALFPDIDTDSKGQNLFYSGLIVLDGILICHEYYFWASWLGLIAMFPALGHHRGWTHTWWAMFLVPLPILIIPYLFFGGFGMDTFSGFYAAFTLGYFSHLLLDRKFV
jgi:membrane-bound metal-dependent hydrolase YbcI (DUF457 family)